LNNSTKIATDKPVIRESNVHPTSPPLFYGKPSIVCRVSWFRTGIEYTVYWSVASDPPAPRDEPIRCSQRPLTIVPHNGTGWEHQPVFLLEPS
jgi:hypothetical protein